MREAVSGENISLRTSRSPHGTYILSAKVSHVARNRIVSAAGDSRCSGPEKRLPRTYILRRWMETCTGNVMTAPRHSIGTFARRLAYLFTRDHLVYNWERGGLCMDLRQINDPSGRDDECSLSYCVTKNRLASLRMKCKRNTRNKWDLFKRTNRGSKHDQISARKVRWRKFRNNLHFTVALLKNSVTAVLILSLCAFLADGCQKSHWASLSQFKTN